MKLFFKVILRDHKNKIPNEMELAIEFFNIETTIWEKIDIQKTTYKEGTYAFEYEIPSRIYGDQPTLRQVREILQTGGMPIFRLIDAKSEKQVHIIASQGVYEILKEDIVCDFRSLYLLEKEHIENLDNPKFSSVPVATTYIDKGSASDELKQEISLLKQQIEELKNNTDTSSNSDELIVQIESQKETIKSLQEVLEKYSKEKENLEEAIHHLTQQNEELSIALSELNETENIENNDLIVSLESEKEALNEQLSAITTQKEELEYSLHQHIETIELLQSQLTESDGVVEMLQSEKAVLENTITQEVNVVSDQIIEINNHRVKEQEQQNIIDALEAEKQVLKSQIEGLSEEKVDQEYIPKSVSANKLYTDVIDEIQIAKENTASSGFKLSNISINLKTVAEKDDQGLRFQVIDINNASSINGAAISDIKIDIAEDERSVLSNDLIAPKLIGLTETAARKYLEKFNLRLDPVYQFMNTENSSISEGQAFKQSPEPGEAIIPDSTITVIFAKNNQNLN